MANRLKQRIFSSSELKGHRGADRIVNGHLSVLVGIVVVDTSAVVSAFFFFFFFFFFRSNLINLNRKINHQALQC